MPQHPFDTLTLETGASFIFTPCPGTKGVSLEDSVAQLKAAGTSAILTLMYDEEMIKHNAQSLLDACKAHEIEWYQLPISDDDAPNQDFELPFKQHLSKLKQVLTEKSTIAVHCKGGSGRTGLVIALLMLELGLDKSFVVEQVKSVRPHALTKPAQLAYFNSY